MTRVFFTNFRQDDRFGRYVQYVTTRPRWVWGTAALIGLLPFAVLIALLVMAALAVFVAVYAVLSAVHECFRLVARTPRPHDGRENVRVKTPSPSTRYQVPQ